MKRHLLTPAQAAWLDATFARNRTRFGGFRRKEDGGDDAATKAAAETAAAEKAAEDKKAEGAKKAAETDLGFPADTPVKEMTVEQRAAYYEHKSRKHEERNKELLKITGGKFGDDLRGDLDELAKLKKAALTDTEKAVDEAKSATRAETVKDVGVKAARAALEIALDHDPDENDQSTLLDTLDMSKLLTDDGSVDTAKVRAVVKQFAPTGKGEGGKQDRDYGGGSRRGGKATSGVAAGRTRYQELHGKKSDKDA